MNNSAAISVAIENGIFNFRVAGVAIYNQKLLLHKSLTDHFWSLPGGRVELFEFSKETLLREMMEETGMSVEVGALVWIAENFFEYNASHYHEIGFYYQMAFNNLPDQDDFVMHDGDGELLFRWIPLSEIDQTKIYPEFITAGLLSKPDCVSHFTISMQNLHL